MTTKNLTLDLDGKRLALTKVRVDRYDDRVSVAFSEDADDVSCIVMVTFDVNTVMKLDHDVIVDKARGVLGQITLSEA